MSNLPILSLLIFLPIISTFFVFVSRKDDFQNAKLVSLWSSFIALTISLIIIATFDFSKNTVQYIEEYNWIPHSNIKFKIGIDRFSVLFVGMIASISFLSMLWIFKKHIHKTKHFFTSILFFQSFAIGAFVSYDLFLMLFFIEATIIPLIIMMNTSKKEEHKNVILQFVVYGTASAVLLTIAFVMIYNNFNTSDLLTIYKCNESTDKLCFWLLLISVGIKMPLFPFCYWLPNVHVKSPTVCSALLAAIVIKFSTLIIVKIMYPLFFNQLTLNTNILSVVCLVGAVSACSLMLFQDDLKKIFAYFSILHINLYMLILLGGIGIKYFAFAILQHSFLITLLFFSTDIIKTIYKTRSVSDLQNNTSYFLSVKYLMLTSILVLIGIPGSWGFVSEIISVYASCKISVYYGFIFSFLILISASYAFYLYQSIFSGWKNNTINAIDMFHISNIPKKTVFIVIFIIIMLFGIFPKILL